MILENLLVYFLQISALFALTLILSSLARKHPALRLAMIRVSLLAAVGLAAASPWIHERENPAIPVSIQSPLLFEPVPLPKDEALPVSKPASAVVVEPTAVTINASSLPEVHPEQLVVLAWGLGGFLLGLNLAFGYATLFRVRRSCRPINLPLLIEICQAQGLRAPQLVEGDAVSSPFVAGVLRPTIFLPSGWLTHQDGETLRAVLQHEVAHVAGGDLRWSLLHRALCIVLWPQPLIWLLKRPMAAAEEELCDRHVLAAGVPDHIYADCLLRLRENLRARACPALGIGAVSSRSSIGKRIDAILDRRRSRSVKISKATKTATRVGALLIAASTGILIARPVLPQGPDPVTHYYYQPYEARVNVTADGKPVTDIEAWLTDFNTTEKPLYQKLDVDGSHVIVPPLRRGGNSSGTLYVFSRAHGLGFRALWPIRRKASELRIQKPRSFEGQLLLPSGAPASGLTVRATAILQSNLGDPGESLVLGTLDHFPFPGFHTTTDLRGRFRFSKLPSNAWIGYDVDDPRFARLTRGTSPTDPSDPIQTVLTPAATLSGTVTRDGRPVPGIRVGASPKDKRLTSLFDGRRTAVTDSYGHYDIPRVEPGIYAVYAQIRQPLSSEVTVNAYQDVKVRLGEKVSKIDLRLIHGAVIEGHLLDPNGKPIPRTSFAISGPATPEGGNPAMAITTDDFGFFKVHVPAGWQRLDYYKVGGSVANASVLVTDGSTTTVDLHAESLAYIEPMDSTHPDEPTVTSFGTGKPFYGPFRLRNGTTVRLRGLHTMNQNAKSYWRPDGTRLSRQEADWDKEGDSEPISSLEERELALAVEVKNANTRDLAYACQSPGNEPHHAEIQLPVGKESNFTLWGMVHFSNSARRTDVKFGIAGPLRTIATCRFGEAPLFAKRLERSTKNYEWHGYRVEADIPASAVGKALYIVAVDQSGHTKTPMLPNNPIQFRGTGRHELDYSTSDMGEIDHFIVQVRDYEWVTFRGIHLYPSGAGQ